jgi:hypothetical protein
MLRWPIGGFAANRSGKRVSPQGRQRVMFGAGEAPAVCTPAVTCSKEALIYSGAPRWRDGTPAEMILA